MKLSTEIKLGKVSRLIKAINLLQTRKYIKLVSDTASINITDIITEIIDLSSKATCILSWRHDDEYESALLALAINRAISKGYKYMLVDIITISGDTIDKSLDINNFTKFYEVLPVITQYSNKYSNTRDHVLGFSEEGASRGWINKELSLIVNNINANTLEFVDPVLDLKVSMTSDIDISFNCVLFITPLFYFIAPPLTIFMLYYYEDPDLGNDLFKNRVLEFMSYSIKTSVNLLYVSTIVLHKIILVVLLPILLVNLVISLLITCLQFIPLSYTYLLLHTSRMGKFIAIVVTVIITLFCFNPLLLLLIYQQLVFEIILKSFINLYFRYITKKVLMKKYNDLNVLDEWLLKSKNIVTVCHDMVYIRPRLLPFSELLSKLGNLEDNVYKNALIKLMLIKTNKVFLTKDPDKYNITNYLDLTKSIEENVNIINNKL